MQHASNESMKRREYMNGNESERMPRMGSYGFQEGLRNGKMAFWISSYLMVPFWIPKFLKGLVLDP